MNANRTVLFNLSQMTEYCLQIEVTNDEGDDIYCNAKFQGI